MNICGEDIEVQIEVQSWMYDKARAGCSSWGDAGPWKEMLVMFYHVAMVSALDYATLCWGAKNIKGHWTVRQAGHEGQFCGRAEPEYVPGYSQPFRHVLAG